MKSIVKDYLTGKEYVEIKRKPDLPIKGCASVYLYNARTGRLELEAHTPNIIYPEIYAWLRSYQWDKFCTGAYNKSNSYSGYWEMDKIFLSSSSKPEDERIDIFTYNPSGTSEGNPGIQIGWADKSTYSGGDALRGTPNTAESYANNQRVHWVFDWPTHAGNGTLQTIIWGNTFNPVANSSLLASTGIFGSYKSTLALATDGSYLYVLGYNGDLYKLTMDGAIQGSSINIGVSAGSDYGFGLTYSNGYLYAITWDGRLYKLTTDGVIQGSGVNTGIISSMGYSNLALATDGSYLYVLRYDGDLYKLTMDGIVQGSSVNVGITDDWLCGFGLVCDGSYLYSMDSNGNISKFTKNGTLIYSYVRAGVPSYGNTGLGFAYANSRFYAIRYNGDLYKVGIRDRYFARTRLAAPVTKTNQQTMKIQYDFIYEE